MHKKKTTALSFKDTPFSVAFALNSKMSAKLKPPSPSPPTRKKSRLPDDILPLSESILGIYLKRYRTPLQGIQKININDR